MQALRNSICYLYLAASLPGLSFNGLILQSIEASFAGTDLDNILNIVYEDFTIAIFASVEHGFSSVYNIGNRNCRNNQLNLNLGQ